MCETNNEYVQPCEESLIPQEEIQEEIQEECTDLVHTEPLEDIGEELDTYIEEGFSKGLAATIMATFPIVSVIAIFYGNKSIKLIKKARKLAAKHGVKIRRKNIAANALGRVGKYAGIVMSLYWVLWLLIILLYCLLIVLIAIGISYQY